jgi:GNAT superfamily N-acetyltransferase
MPTRPPLPEPWRYVCAADADQKFSGLLGHSMRDYLRESREPGHLVLVRERGDEIAGVAWVEVHRRALIVHHLETNERHQGQGVATELLRVIERIVAPANRCREIRLSALDDPDLIAWYERRGFQRTGPRIPEDGYGKVQPMVKRLA